MNAHDEVRSVEDLRSLAARTAADNQTIIWRPTAWKKHFAPYTEHLDTLAGGTPSEHASIKRSSIYEMASIALSTGDAKSAREAFLTIMIWGRGTDNRGPALTQRMMERPHFDQTLLSIMATASSSSSTPADSFLSLFSARRSRIRGLGIAFGTKLIHAFGEGHSERPPLVYDNLVMTALRALREKQITGVPAAPSPWRFMRASQYQDYCYWVQDQARAAGVPPRDVEYALFRIGRSLKQVKT